MKKLSEYTGGSYIYMKILMDDGKIEEISCYGYCFNDATRNRCHTTADETSEARREEIISAFNALY